MNVITLFLVLLKLSKFHTTRIKAKRFFQYFYNVRIITQFLYHRLQFCNKGMKNISDMKISKE